MTQEHPITPPTELVLQWHTEADNQLGPYYDYIATQAARWGADEQLEMDATWVALQTSNQISPNRLIAEMRPKPLTLKEQALQALDCLCVNHTKATAHENTIRHALEQLND